MSITLSIAKNGLRGQFILSSDKVFSKKSDEDEVQASCSVAVPWCSVLLGH